MAKNNSSKFGGPMFSLVRKYNLALSSSYLLHRKSKRLILTYSSKSISSTLDTIIATLNLTISDHLQRPLIDQAKRISLYKDGVSAGVPRSSRPPEFVNFRHLYQTLTMPLLSLNL